MPACTIYRTHQRGRALPKRDWQPVPGPVDLFEVWKEDQRRNVKVLAVERMEYGGKAVKPPIPPLLDPELITFHSGRAAMVRGFEEVDGVRYYQAWFLEWNSRQ